MVARLRGRILVLSLIALLFLALAVQAEPSRVVQAEEILKKIELGQPVEYDNVTIVGDLDVSTLNLTKVPVQRTDYDTRYPDLLDYEIIVASPIRITNSRINGSVNLNGTIMQNVTRFKNTTFDRPIFILSSIFKRNADFRWVKFNKNADFSNAQFKQGADFEWAKFNENVDFGRVKFSKDADFSNAQFNQTATFEGIIYIQTNGERGPSLGISTEGAEFKKNAYFEGAEFKQDAYFQVVKFNKGAYFIGAKFNQFAWFIGAKFIKDTDFSDVQFKQDAHFSNVQFKHDADFEGAKFNGNVDFGSVNFNKDAHFSNVKFNQSAWFGGSSYIQTDGVEKPYWRVISKGVMFNQFADFRGAEFKQDAIFSESMFNKDADFVGIEFNQSAYFSNAQFKENASFTGSEFNQTTDFRDAQFNQANFVIAKFNQTADFRNAQFNQTDFRNVQFNQTADFRDARFNRKANFWEAQFKKDADFKGTQFNQADFGNTQFSQEAYFQEAKFLHLSFNYGQFSKEAFFEGARISGTLFLYRTKYDKLNIRWSSIHDLAYDDTAYYLLIENFKKQGFTDDSSECYYSYRCKHREELFRQGKFDSWFFDLLAWATNGYGLRPVRPLGWSFLFILLGGVFFFLTKSINRSKGPEPSRNRWRAIRKKELPQRASEVSIWEALLLSATYFTSGASSIISSVPEEFSPLGRSRYVVVILRLLGWIFFVLFLTSLGKIA